MTTSIETLNGQGFVRLVDTMGDDSSIVQAARISYGKGTKTVRQDEGLIRYLMRHRHCYHPSMQVLTVSGWKRWDECDYVETFLVPDPETKTLRKETLPVEVFYCEEEMAVFGNQRMSYCVTQDHRMWFKPKHKDDFEIVHAGEMGKWGHFDPSAGYRLVPDDVQGSPFGKLIGFFLGDGSWSGRGISFHLRKDRKKRYLRAVLSDLDLKFTESPSATYDDAVVIYITKDEIARVRLLEYVDVGCRAADKSLRRMSTTGRTLTDGEVVGVFDGLTNSDGHVREDRNGRIEFSSISSELASTFEALASQLGYDAHRRSSHEINVVHAHPPGRTSLEARKHYFRTEYYSGKVYCSTTSTGLLMVRGGSTEFGFVCGNTTPFEMCEAKFHIRIPMDAWRQMIRHRTANVNEYSTRYSEAIDEMATTPPDQWRNQSRTNKQGSASVLPEDTGKDLTKAEGSLQEMSRDVYRMRLDFGVAREQARKDLPLSTFTEAYWKIDLHNLLHFLTLRLSPHAQQEIREYAEALATFVKEWVPLTWAAFEDYRLGAVTLSAREVECIRSILQEGSWPTKVMHSWGWSPGPSREFDEFLNKMVSLGFKVPGPK